MTAGGESLLQERIEKERLRVAVRVPVKVQVQATDGGPPLVAWANASDIGWRTAVEGNGTAGQLWVWLPAPTADLLRT